MASRTLLVALSTSAVMCATSIIGGTVAVAGDVPYAVSKQYLWWPYHFCTGSLLDATTVLMAGHCFYDMWGLEASDVVVRIGGRSRPEGGTLANVSSMVVHPSFTDEQFAFDVAIVKLQEPIATTGTGSLIGVTSWGSEGCGDDGYVGVYARVGQEREFIGKYTEGRGNI